MSERKHHNHASIMNGLERDAMKTPEDVTVMLRLHQLGWGSKRIAKELGISRNTVKKYVAQRGYQAYKQPERQGALDDLQDWVKAQFLQHRGNAEVVRQELVKQHGIKVSLRTVERAVAGYRQELEASAKATLRFETPPGKQLQIDFGSTKIEIGGALIRVFLFVATLGFSRRIYVEAFRHEGQVSWLTGLDGAFRHFNGIPEEVLMDNAKALVKQHDMETREVVFNERLLSFASYWGFKPRACAPYRARTKGKDERSVSYVKGNAIAGRTFENWSALERHLHTWCLEIADQRVHGTTAEKPILRFQEQEHIALKPLKGKPPFLQSRDYQRKVHTDAHVEFETNKYSVPWTHIGKPVRVGIRQDVVCIYLEDQEISRHQRQQGSLQRVTKREHLEGIVGIEKAEEPAARKEVQNNTGVLQRSLSEYEEICGGLAS
jgi:transposase